MTRHGPNLAAGLGGALAIPLAATRLGLAPLVLTRLAILGGALGQIALVDMRERRVPNRIVLPATAICAALSIAEWPQAKTSNLLVAAGLVVILLAVSLAKPAVLGMGDVKLALLLLAALGGLASAALLITLELYALLAILLLIRRGRRALGSTLPLAPIAAVGCILALLL